MQSPLRSTWLSTWLGSVLTGYAMIVKVHDTRMSELQLFEYQASWPTPFRQVAAELRSTISAPGASIEHIGSTSVPGLCSKPVLDILLGVASLSEVEAAIPALRATGFVYRPEYEHHIPDRRYLVRPAGPGPRVHLHAVRLGGLLWQQYLNFRERLRHDAGLRQSYAALKRALAVVHAANKAACTEAKAQLLTHVLSSGLDRTISALQPAAAAFEP